MSWEKIRERTTSTAGPIIMTGRLWAAREVGEDSVVFLLDSPDGDQGFPGELKISVKYTLTKENAVDILYAVTSDRDTPVNMTNHAYFNLGGHRPGSVIRVQILADSFTPTDADSIPTGEILAVEGTPMDFRTPKTMGTDIGSDYIQIVQGKGFDHNWCLNHAPGICGLAASAYHEASGRAMDVYTDLPGVQFYTGNWLGGEKGKGGVSYEDRDAFCLENRDLSRFRRSSPVPVACGQGRDRPCDPGPATGSIWENRAMEGTTSKNAKLLATAGFLFITMIWGGSFVVMKNSVDLVPPSYLLALRFTLAAASWPWRFPGRMKKLDRGSLTCGLIMGILGLTLAYLFQTYGIKYTTASKNAFITALYVVLVPFLYWKMSKKRPGLNNLRSRPCGGYRSGSADLKA